MFGLFTKRHNRIEVKGDSIFIDNQKENVGKAFELETIFNLTIPIPEIKVYENKISSTGLTIQELNLQIGDKQLAIDRNIKLISDTIQKASQEESSSVVETFLNYKRVGAFWDRVNSLEELSQALKDNLHQVRFLKNDLEMGCGWHALLWRWLYLHFFQLSMPQPVDQPLLLVQLPHRGRPIAGWT